MERFVEQGGRQFVVAARIKLYGERNTGTRYLTRLFEHNLGSHLIAGTAPRWTTWAQALVPGSDYFRDAYFERTFSRNYGWKHSQVQTGRLLELGDEIDDVHFVVLVKNPYSWLLSLDKRPYHSRSNPTDDSSGIEYLLSSEWPTVGRENGPPVYRDAIDLWNQKLASYLELARRLPTTLLTYEDLVADPATAVEKVRLAGADSWKRGSFENTPESTKDKSKDSSYYRDYYGNERWKSKLTANVIAMVNERISGELMSEFGYEKL
jgi:hypothetical protein